MAEASRQERERGAVVSDEPKTDAPDTPKSNADADPPSAPAVHSDELWGGPRFIHNATGDPVYVETQAEYWALLNRMGLRMKDQQESTTGPEVLKDPEPVPVHLTPAPPVAPMSMDEAQIYGAITAVFKRYGIVESIWCDHCFARHVPHGCRMRVTSRGVLLQCRCGVAEYKAPAGTTDLVLSKVATSAVTLNDTTSGTISTPAGPEFRPTTFLHDMEAILIRRYIWSLRQRGKDPRLFHIGCWRDNPLLEDDAIGISVEPSKIVFICKCRTLIHVERGALKVN
jgi:hypothetical protein